MSGLKANFECDSCGLKAHDLLIVHEMSQEIQSLRKTQAELVKAIQYTLDHSLLYRVAGWEGLQAALDMARAAEEAGK